MIADTENILKKHYHNLVMKYGDSPESSQWSSLETQEMRFSVLLDIADVTNKKILDYGCSTAAMADYLKKNEIECSYTGVDIVEESLRIGETKYPQFDFHTNTEFDKRTDKYDYVFLSGVFNNLIEGINPHDYWTITLRKIWQRTNMGLAFNMMSSYVDYYADNLYYVKPEEVFSFCKKELSSFVVLRNEYQVKKGIIPFEFTVYVYRK